MSSVQMEKAVIAFSLIFFAVCAADVMVQLNVNRPFNDVSEKFVSFAIKPEELYKALDGPNRKSMTRMAAMLGDSHIKFVGDYYFTSNSETKLRNPTKIIWKGFNRWTRAVNWTMIIPVPYSPDSWDPMHTLKILNNSYLIGISDCIWQLGTDFGSSRAKDYVTELNTLNLMVDSFKPYVDDWKIMGADVSAGSSAEETRRYIEMSKDLNAAFGWTQPADLMPSNSMNSYIYDSDPALKMLLSKKVPVWLSLPQKSKSKKQTKQNLNRPISDETTDALRWAQTLGDAASTGFDAVFKRISISDMERPTYSFYVTALFKKVMGSRVFPARPLHILANNNKLYTHCANTVSGGIAFMVVNMDENPMQISVRSLTKLMGTEVWQYALTYKKGAVMLNNEKLTLNSTLKPQIKVKNPDKPVPLSTPGMSVSFWVLPTVNLEHCQYTEIEAEEASKESGERLLQKRYSSSDRLLRKLIQETSLSHSAFSRAINRRRRYATFANRPKRFVLEDKSNDFKGFGKFFSPLAFAEKTVKKREYEADDRPAGPLQWFQKLLDRPIKAELPLLKRGARSAENYFGPFFATKDGKKTSFTRKITEIKKPEKKTKPIFDLEEFDEEEFFKKIQDNSEPEYQRLPEGDVHLKHITNADGEEVDDYKEEKKRKKAQVKTKKTVQHSKETVSEMKPLRLLPTEFYEALPVNSFKPAAQSMKIGSALNSLLFPEPFSKKVEKSFFKPNKKIEEDHPSDAISEVEEMGTGKFQNSAKHHNSGKLAQDFLRAQKELSKSFLNDNFDHNENKKDHDEGEEEEQEQEQEENEEQFKTHKTVTENFESYFGEHEELAEEKPKENETKKIELDEIPWWDLSSLRKKRATRALKIQIPDDDWRSNMIDKEDDLTPLGATMPEHLAMYEYQVPELNKKQKDAVISNKLVTTVKRKVTNFVDIVARHVNEWYNTLTKHIPTSGVEPTKPY